LGRQIGEYPEMAIRLEVDTGLIADDEPRGTGRVDGQWIQRGRDARLRLALPADEEADERVERVATCRGAQGFAKVVPRRGGRRDGAQARLDAGRGVARTGQRFAQPVDVGGLQEHPTTVGCVIVTRLWHHFHDVWLYVALLIPVAVMVTIALARLRPSLVVGTVDRRGGDGVRHPALGMDDPHPLRLPPNSITVYLVPFSDLWHDRDVFQIVGNCWCSSRLASSRPSGSPRCEASRGWPWSA
jgi:hypothetical protein